MKNLHYDETAIGRAVDKIRSMVEVQDEYRGCKSGEDYFNYQLRMHDSIIKNLNTHENFRNFNLDSENAAFFDTWAFMLTQNSEQYAAEAWSQTKVKNVQQLATMIKGQVAVVMWQIFFFGNFLHKRGRRFRLAPGLAKILFHTDVKVPASDIRPPFPFMAIQLPPGILNLVEEGKESMDCSYLVLTRQRMAPADMVEECAASPDGLVDTLTVLALSTPSQSDPFGELTLVDTMTLREGFTVDEEIKAYVERRRPEHLGHHLQLEIVEGRKRYGSPIANMFSLAANIVLYSTNRSADIVAHNQRAIDKVQRQVLRHPPGSKKRKRTNEKLQHLKAQSIHIIGGSFKPKDERVAQSTTSRAVSVRHMVRGHWKLQVCGVGRRERKHIFVEPYMRGKNLVEMIERDYTLKE